MRVHKHLVEIMIETEGQVMKKVLRARLESALKEFFGPGTVMPSKRARTAPVYTRRARVRAIR